MKVRLLLALSVVLTACGASRAPNAPTNQKPSSAPSACTAGETVASDDTAKQKGSKSSALEDARLTIRQATAILLSESATDGARPAEKPQAAGTAEPPKDATRGAPAAKSTIEAQPAPRVKPATSTSLSDGVAERTDSCLVLCRAMISLNRATEELCELVGESDAECTYARATAAKGRARCEGRCGCD